MKNETVGYNIFACQKHNKVQSLCRNTKKFTKLMLRTMKYRPALVLLIPFVKLESETENLRKTFKKFCIMKQKT